MYTKFWQDRLGKVSIKDKELRANCPVCREEKGHFYANVENGQWDCKKCGTSGNAISYLKENENMDKKEVKKELKKYNLSEPTMKIKGSSNEPEKEVSEDVLDSKLVDQYLSNITEEQRKELSEERKLPIEILKKYKVGMDEKGYYTIPIYTSSGKLTDIRRKKFGEPTMSTPGAKVGLFGIQNLVERNFIYLYEGCWDGMSGEVHGFPGVGVPGAGTFKDEWKSLFKDKEIMIVFDLDKAGRDGALNCAKRIAPAAGKVGIISLPDELGPGGDVRDFWNNGGTEEKFKELIKAAEVINIQTEQTKPEFPRSQADALLELLKKLREQGQVSYFRDELGEVWAKIMVGAHHENYPIDSRYFKLFARRKFHEVYEKAINKDALSTALSNVEAVLPNLEQHEVHLRVAQKDENLYYDLSNSNWEVIRVDREGWELINDCPVHFKRFPHQKPQVIPEKEGGDIWQLFEFLNLQDEESRILTVVQLVTSFVPRIPHPMTDLSGDHGSGKSLYLSFKRELIDPSVITLLSLNNDRMELVQQISHNYFCPYDNITSLQDWASDSLCRAVTGEGVTKRRLYTNDEDIIYHYRRVIAVNGINCVALRPDLLDRSILIRLSRIPRNRRKEEKELWKSFNEAKPKILGGIFNTLSQALRILPSINLESLPRMADFAHWGYAIAEVLGIGGERFLQVYYSNMQIQNVQAIEGDPIATCLNKFIQDKVEWVGSATKLLAELEKVAEILRIKTTKDNGWVTTPQHLTRKLNILKVNLEDVGITYTNNHKEAGSNIYISYQKNTDSIVSSVRSSATEGDNDDGALTTTDAESTSASASESTVAGKSDDADAKFSTKSEKVDKFRQGGEEENQKEKGELGHKIINKQEDFTLMLEEIRRKEEITFDLETTGLDPMTDEVVGIALTLDEEHSFYVPIGHANGQQLPVDYVMERLKTLLESDLIGKIGHNLKFDCLMLRKYGIRVRPHAFDTMIAAHLLDENARKGLKVLAHKFLGVEMTTFEGVTTSYDSFGEVPIEEAAEYAVADAFYTRRLKELFGEELKKEKLEKVFELEMKVSEVVTSMIYEGIAVNLEGIEPLRGTLEEEKKKIEEKIYELAEEEFNINSPKQLGSILYEKLELPMEKFTATGMPSTSESALEKLKDKYPIAGCILKFRETNKLLTSFVNPLPEQISKKTNKIHTNLNQIGTRTGRFSCSDPNLQNIPKEIKRVFIAQPGYMLLSADYSQIELRVLAQYSQDPRLIKAYQEEEDIHKQTASLVFKVPVEEVSEEQRTKAKSVNFGIIYGITEYGLSEQLGVSEDEAGDFIEKYFEAYPKVEKYMEAAIAELEEGGFVTTLLGRKRRLPGINSGSNVEYKKAQRQAINSKIQGTAADIMKIAMIRVHKALTEHDAKILLQVHDELLLEVREDQVEEISSIVKKEMEKEIEEFEIPLKVDLKAGKNWGEMEEWKS